MHKSRSLYAIMRFEKVGMKIREKWGDQDAIRET